jgi:hypothetical protein
VELTANEYIAIRILVFITHNISDFAAFVRFVNRHTYNPWFVAEKQDHVGVILAFTYKIDGVVIGQEEPQRAYHKQVVTKSIVTY